MKHMQVLNDYITLSYVKPIEINGWYVCLKLICILATQFSLYDLHEVIVSPMEAAHNLNIEK